MIYIHAQKKKKRNRIESHGMANVLVFLDNEDKKVKLEELAD